MSQGPNTQKQEYINKIYQGVVLTISAVAVSLVSKKAFGESLGTPQSMNGTLKLAGSVMVGSVIVKYLEDSKFIPEKINLKILISKKV